MPFRSARPGALMLLATAFAVSAQTPPPSFESRTGQPLPKAGAYFDPAQPGVGLMLDVGLDGTVFAGLGAYDASGAPRFHTLQGAIRREGLTGDAATWIGVVRSPVWTSRDGQCLGCDWRPAITEADAALGEAELRFTAASAVELRLAGSTWRMQRMEIDRSPAELFAGDYLWVRDFRTTGAPSRRQLARIAVSATPPVAVRVDGPAACAAAPAPGTPMFELSCRDDCADFESWRGVAGRRVLAWPGSEAATFHVAPASPLADGGFVVAAGAVRTLHAGAFAARSGLADPRCSGPDTHSTLHLYRDPVTSAIRFGAGDPVQPWVGSDAFLATDGIYFDPAQPGTGVMLSRGVDGTLFAGWFGYERDGRSTYRLFQDRVRHFESASVTGRVGPIFLGDVTGIVAAPLRSMEGQVVGQAWRPNRIATDTDAGTAALVTGGPSSYLSTELQAWFAGRSQRLARLPIDRPGPDFVRDRWLLVSDTLFSRDANSPFPSDPQRTEVRSVVVIEPLPPEIVASLDGYLQGGDQAYVLRCVEECAGFDTLRNWLPTERYGTPGAGEFILVLRAVDRGASGVDDARPTSHVWASLRVVTINQGILPMYNSSRPRWLLGALNRDHLLGRGFGVLCDLEAICPNYAQQGTLRLLRYPRDPE